MPTITRIAQQKDKNRVNIYLDGKFGFGIDLDNFVILKLKIGQELNDVELQEILKAGEFQKTLDKVLRWATVRPRSIKEVKDYFKIKKVPESLWDDLIAKLIDFGLLNDEEFAKWWVESRQEFSPKSKRVLIQELKLKGITSDIISKVLESTDLDEETTAKNFLKKRELHWKAIPKETRQQKMLIFLVGKGFSFDLAQKAVKEYNITHD
jgi:regulatory protein